MDDKLTGIWYRCDDLIRVRVMYHYHENMSQDDFNCVGLTQDTQGNPKRSPDISPSECFLYIGEGFAPHPITNTITQKAPPNDH